MLGKHISQTTSRRTVRKTGQFTTQIKLKKLGNEKQYSFEFINFRRYQRIESGYL